MVLYKHLYYSFGSLLSFYHYGTSKEKGEIFAPLGNSMQMQDFCKYLDVPVV